MMGKYLGKITAASYGSGGYQDVQLGLSVSFSFDGSCGIADFWGFWGAEIDRSDHAKWTEEERIEHHGKTAMRISQLLADAKVKDVSRLVGTPVEITLQGNSLSEWRVLTEVL